MSWVNEAGKLRVLAAAAAAVEVAAACCWWCSVLLSVVLRNVVRYLVFSMSYIILGSVGVAFGAICPMRPELIINCVPHVGTCVVRTLRNCSYGIWPT